MAVRPFAPRYGSRSTAIDRGPGGVIGRRFVAFVAAALLAGIPGTVVLAGAGDPTGTITMSVPNHAAAPSTVSLSGTWIWPEFKTACGPGTSANRAAGWAIDWGDGFTGNRSLRKDSNPASYAHLGDATDNTVHRSTRNSGLGDCGAPTPQGATGTWGPITHTYPGPGTYTACVSIYDVHYKNVDRTKLSAAITGQSTFNVAKGSTLAVGDVLLIDKEQMLVTGVTGNTITVTRGVNGTSVANHKKDAVVKEIVPSDPKQLVAGSNAAKYGAGDHNGDNSVENNKTADAQCLPVTFRVYGPSSINVAKTANVTQAHVGDTVTYTFTVTNPGDSPLIVQVLDPKCDHPGDLGQHTGDTNLDTKLDKTETWTYTCTHIVVDGDGDPLHNVVTATGVDLFGTVVADTDSFDVDVLHPGIGVVKSANVTQAHLGDTVTYTLTVTDTGDTPLSTIQVFDAKCDSGTLSGPVGDTGNDGRMMPNEVWTYTCTHVVVVADGNPLHNEVTVLADGGVGSPIDGHDTNDIAILPSGLDVSVTKNDGVTSAVPGTSTTYTIVVHNSGPSTATNVAVSDPIPSGVTSFTWSGNGHSNVSGAISDSIASLALGASVTYTVVASVSASASGISITNIVSVTAANDTNPGNNIAIDTDILTPQNDVSVTKNDGVTSAVPGTSTTYTIVVHNSGPSTATNVAVIDPIPSGVTSFTWSGNGHSNVSAAISDTIASLAPGASVTYTVVASVSASATGSITNIVTVTAANDTNPGNNSATDTDTVNVPSADVSITKSDGVATVSPGQQITYTVDVNNHASSGPAIQVEVTDPFPAGLTNISWFCYGATLGGSNPSDCATHASHTGTFDETVTLFPGGHVGYTITATVTAGASGSIQNTATATYANDPDTSNNSATDTDTVSAGAGSATDDSYTGAIGNTKLAVGVTVSGEPVVSQAGSVLANDSGTTLTAVLLTPNVAGGRIVDMNSNGTFTYVPAPGFTGTDTFQYTLMDGGTPTGTGTVSVIVSNMVWYVNNALAPAGDGRSTSPFNSLTPLNGGTDPDGSGDIIFVYQGSSNYGGLALETNQHLIGQPNGLVVAAQTLVAASGTNPVLVNGSGNCITLASGNEIQGVSTGNCSGTGIAGTGVGTLTIGSTAFVDVVNGTGKAVDIDTGVMAVTLNEASSTGSATNGMRLANTTGTFTANSGTIQTAAGDGVSLSNATNVNLSGMTIKNNLGSGIKGTGVTGFSIAGSSVTGNGDDAAADEAGIRFDGLLGTASILTTEVSGSVKDNVRIVNSAGTLTSLALTNDTIKDNSATTGNNGLTVEANGTATMTVSVSGGTFSGNRARGIKATTNSAGHLDLTVANGTYATNLIHVDIADNSTGGLKFNVLGNTMSTTHATDGSPINVLLGTGGTGAAMTGTIDSNTITNDNSPTGPGINVLATGTGKIIVAITGNNVSQVANLGISATASQGSSQLEATITGNTVTLASSAAVNDIFVASGSSLTTDTNAVCASISGNTATTASSSGDTALRVRNRQAGTTFRLPGFGGPGSSDAAVVTFLSGTNGGASASATHAADFTAGGSACQLPPP